MAYTLTLEQVDFLTSSRAQAALGALRGMDLGETELLHRLTELRQSFVPAEAGALLGQALLQQRAAAKFLDADRLLFTEEALEQASTHEVARYRAERFGRYRCVADLGCGIGADTLALAEVVPEVIAVERDPVRAQLTTLNAAARGLAHKVRVLCGDWTQMMLPVEAAFADPSRRHGERRVFGLHQMEPPISAVLHLLNQVPDVAVKVAPGVQHDEVPSEAEVEFISERGALKEALLLFGGLRSGVRWRATLLPGRHHLEASAPPGSGPARQPGSYLYEPDPAVLRAGLVTVLADQIGAEQIDSTIAYLTSDTLTPTPWARVWRVERHGPFHLKTLRRWVREMGAGEVIVKKRGSPIDTDAFRRRLPTTLGGPCVTVFLTRSLGRPWMVLGAEIKEP